MKSKNLLHSHQSRPSLGNSLLCVMGFLKVFVDIYHLYVMSFIMIFTVFFTLFLIGRGQSADSHKTRGVRLHGVVVTGRCEAHDMAVESQSPDPWKNSVLSNEQSLQSLQYSFETGSQYVAEGSLSSEGRDRIPNISQLDTLAKALMEVQAQ